MIEDVVIGCMVCLLIYLSIGLIFVFFASKDMKRLIDEAGGIENYRKKLTSFYEERSLKIHPKNVIWFTYLFIETLWPIVLGMMFVASCEPGPY